MASSSSMAADGASWQCSACTFSNQGCADSCEICMSPRPVSPGQWACSACSFHNSVAVSDTCTMCGTKRSLQVEDDSWTCRFCTFSNPAIALTCSMCSHSRQGPESPMGVRASSSSSIGVAAREDVKPVPPRPAAMPHQSSSSSIGVAARENVKSVPQRPAAMPHLSQGSNVVPSSMALKRSASQASCETQRLTSDKQVATQAPSVLGSEMTAIHSASLQFRYSFKEKAIQEYIEPRREKTRERGSYKVVTHQKPSRNGTLRSHELEDSSELEAKLGIPADEIGFQLAATCGWQELALPPRQQTGQTMRDFEDCMRAAVALNAYSTQLLVTNGTTLMYQQIQKRNGRRPGKLNMLSRTNDSYKDVRAWEIRAYCVECGRQNKSMTASSSGINQQDANHPFAFHRRDKPDKFRSSQGDGWMILPEGLRPSPNKHVPADVLEKRTRDLESKMASLHDACAGHEFAGARFMVDKSVPLGMELRYSHESNSRVRVEFALPLKAIAELASYSAYWPPASESARFRLLSRPLQESENGLESIELKPSRGDGQLVAVAAQHTADQPAFHVPSAHNSLLATASSLQRLILPLTDGQLRTLCWALSRESRDGAGTPGFVEGGDAGDSDFVSTHVIDRRFGESDLVLQLRVERVFSGVRGGILAHTMGYGKTAIIIALIHCACRANESVKLQGGSKRHKSSSEGGTTAQAVESDDTGVIESSGRFCTRATLIITPANLFHQWLLEFAKFLGGDYDGLRLLPIEDMQQFSRLSRMDIQNADVVVVSSTFFLSDEYQRHLSIAAAIYSPSATLAEKYAALRRKSETSTLGRKRKQTGIHDGALILELFDWHRVVFDEFHKCVGNTERHSASWRALHEIRARYRWGLTATPDLTLPLRVSEMAALLHVFVPPDNRIEAQRFLDLWVRADEWDMSGIKVVNHTVLVQQTPLERALYLAKKQWLEGRGDAEKELLPFCSHFDPEALNNDGTAGAAVEKVLQQQKVERSQQQQEISELHFKLHNSKSDDPFILRARLSTAEQKLAQMTRTITFLTQTLEYIAKLDEGGQHECSICLEDCSAGDVSVTRCGHIFCTDCISGMLAAGTKECPTCRQQISRQDVDPILRLKKSAPGAADVDCSRYGTKIAKIVVELRRIHSEDSMARVLVFVQWNELLLKLEAALEHYDVHCVALRGGVADRQRTITAFAEGSKRYVLLMAMEHDDSGLNLTCSNHVFFVHPMAAEPEVIRACERQALGRVRRRGQAKDVNLYRFVAAGTVEEAHAKHHHDILFPE